MTYLIKKNENMTQNWLRLDRLNFPEKKKKSNILNFEKLGSWQQTALPRPPIPDLLQPDHEQGGGPVHDLDHKLVGDVQFPPDLGLSPDGVLGVVPVQGFTRFLALPDPFIVQV